VFFLLILTNSFQKTKVERFLVFGFWGVYEPEKRQSFRQIFNNALISLFLSFLILVFALYLMKRSDISRIMMGLFWLFSLVGLVGSKTTINYLVNIRKKRDFNLRNILIIGDKEKSEELISTIVKIPNSGVKFLGTLDVDDERVGKEITSGIRVLGTVDKFYDTLRSETVDEVLFAVPLRNIENAKDYITHAETIGITVRILPDWEIQRIMYEPSIGSVFFNLFAGMPTMVLSSVPSNEGMLYLKSFMDYSMAVIGLVLISPFWLLIALTIKLTSKGPVFYSQERSGLGGRKFKMLKFRTMVWDAEKIQDSLWDKNEADIPVFKIADDPRITWFGKVLRKTSLDESPQFINILKGEMSLVGPRPPLPAEVEQYQTWQRRRLSMKPGITCIWQVSGRNEIGFDTWMEMDLAYIDNWSLWLDIKLILLTIPAVLLLKGV